METLKSQIAAFREKFSQKAGAEKVKIIEDGISSQVLNRGPEGVLKVGDRVNDFSFTDVNRDKLSLYQLLDKGPVIVNFYRGGWCPYCNLELRAYQALIPDFNKLGATLIALSPERLEVASDTASKNQLSFSVGTDEGLKISKSFGLVFELSDDLKELYKDFGNVLPEINGNGLWELPVPATFVIGKDQKISFAYVNSDYRERLEPSDLIDHLRRNGRP